MEKQHIIAEIRRIAQANDGRPLGRARFEAETGITMNDWYGKHWARWSDALIEAGFRPNELNAAYDDEWVIEQLVNFIRELGHYPTSGELRIRARSGDFPSHNVFGRLGRKAELAAKVLAWCQARHGYDDIIQVCSPIAATNVVAKNGAHEDGDREVQLGWVYLMKSGRNYKLGRTVALSRRERELAIQLPEKAVTVHAIKTDDPAGIEAYWHRRFADRRLNGEWFALNAADVRAFKRRKFM